MKIFLRITEWIIFIVLICAITVIASPFLLSKQIVSSYTVVSGSMEPAIAIGTLTFVQQTPFSALQKGDIIAFTDPTDKNRTILHRIYSVAQSSSGRTLQTKGDHNRYPDGWKLTSAMIKGKLFYTIPYLGNLSEWLKSPLGFGIMVGIPALVFIILSIMKIREGIKEEIAKGIAKNENKSPSSSHMTSLMIVPLLVVTFILAFVPSVYAIKFGHATVAFSVSTTVVTPTPTVAPTNTPTPTGVLQPTATPTPSSSPCGGNTNINVSGNGAGSNNNVNVTNNCNTTITQTNNTSTTMTINSTVSTGGNTVSNNTSSTGLTLISGSVNSVISITTQSSSNSANILH